MLATTQKYFYKWASDRNSKYYSVIERSRMAGFDDDNIMIEIVKSWEEKGRIACDKGTYMHRQIELYLNGQESDESLPEMTQFKQFMQEVIVQKKWIPFRTEWSIFDNDRMIAGQVDCIFKHETRPEYHMVDWKRCAKPLVASAGMNFNKYGYSPCDFLVDNSWSHYAAQQNIYMARF